MTDYSMKFTLFTDGSALSNKKDAKAGWAFYFPKIKVLVSDKMIGTNNQAELSAMKNGLKYFHQNLIDENIPDNTLYVFSDSEYTINSITGKYNGKINKEMINDCKKLIEQINEKKQIKFIHVRAHTNKTDFVSTNNDIVDKTARKEAESI